MYRAARNTRHIKFTTRSERGGGSPTMRDTTTITQAFSAATHRHGIAIGAVVFLLALIRTVVR